MAAYEVLLLNTAVPQIQAAQSGDTYVVPRDIAFSAALTLSAGTANGVAFLNASKVLTTGSALTFDGTNLSVGGSNSQQRLNVVVPVFTTNASGGMRIGDSGNNYYVDQLVTTDGSANPFWDVKFATHTLSRYAYGGGNNFWAWYTNNTEQMRLTSTGLGIGTSSISDRLTVAGNVTIPSNNFYKMGTGNYLYSDGANTVELAAGTSGKLSFVTNGGLRATLDSSGNLGLGVVPSAWAGGFKVFAIGGNNVWSTNDSNTLYFTQNSYFDGSFKYQGSSLAATSYEMTNGTFKWFIAPSGTAGNAISFTQALTLDANRNLLLNGTAAPASGVGTLAIFNGTAPTGSVTNGIVLYAEDVSSSSELKVRDEAGNVTTLSPHNFELIPEGPSEDMAWSYYSERDGKRINVDMLKAIRLLEKLSGEQLVYEA